MGYRGGASRYRPALPAGWEAALRPPQPPGGRGGGGGRAVAAVAELLGAARAGGAGLHLPPPEHRHHPAGTCRSWPPPASFFPGGTSRAPRVKATPWRCLVAPPFPCPRLKSWHTDPMGSPAATSLPAPGGVLGWGPSLQPAFSCQDRELRPEEIEGKAWGRCPQLESPLSPTRHPFPSAHPTLWPGGVAEGGCPPVPPASLRCPQS